MERQGKEFSSSCILRFYDQARIIPGLWSGSRSIYTHVLWVWEVCVCQGVCVCVCVPMSMVLPSWATLPSTPPIPDTILYSLSSPSMLLKRWNFHNSFSILCASACVLSHFSCVQLLGTLWTVVCQAPLSKGFSRQEYWSELLFPPPGNFPNPRSPLIE